MACGKQFRTTATFPTRRTKALGSIAAASTRSGSVNLRRPACLPFQALVLMNDTTFVEAARKMAERIMIEGGRKPIDRLRFGFRLATGQWPSSRDIAVLSKVYHDQREEYRNDEMAVAQLLNVGQSQPVGSLDCGELATWTVVAHTILNMNKTITKD